MGCAQSLGSLFLQCGSLDDMKFRQKKKPQLFGLMQIQTDEYCGFDSLAIYDGAFVDEDDLVAKICNRGTDEKM